MLSKLGALVIGLCFFLWGIDRWVLDAQTDSEVAELYNRVVETEKYSNELQVKNQALQKLERWSQGDTALALLAKFESLDLKLRMGELEGIDSPLRELEKTWSEVPSIALRARALRGLLRTKQSLFVEPNAVADLDVGTRFRERFLQDDISKKTFKSIPLDFPVLYLNDRADALVAKGAKVRVPTVLVLVQLEDLIEAEKQLDENQKELSPLARCIQLADQQGFICILLTYMGSLPSIEWEMEKGPWSSTCILWVSGTFQSLEGVPRRTRYEWMPGTSFFRLGPGNSLISWRMPWDPWEPFEKSLK